MNRRIKFKNDVFIEITSPKILTDSEMCDYLKRAIDVISTNSKQIIDTLFFIDNDNIIHELKVHDDKDSSSIMLSECCEITGLYDKQKFMKILYSDGVLQYVNRTFIIGKTRDEAIDRFQKHYFHKS